MEKTWQITCQKVKQTVDYQDLVRHLPVAASLHQPDSLPHITCNKTNKYSHSQSCDLDKQPIICYHHWYFQNK